jgi:hypothetical protein
MFGIDPDQARKEIEALIGPKPGSDQTDETLREKNKILW